MSEIPLESRQQTTGFSLRLHVNDEVADVREPETTVSAADAGVIVFRIRGLAAKIAEMTAIDAMADKHHPGRFISLHCEPLLREIDSSAEALLRMRDSRSGSLFEILEKSAGLELASSEDPLAQRYRNAFRLQRNFIGNLSELAIYCANCQELASRVRQILSQQDDDAGQ